jgi:integrase
MPKRVPTQYPGVFYLEHHTRKHNGKPDRSFYIRYKRSGKAVDESVGWASRHMNAQKTNKLRAEITQNIKLGVSPQSVKEKRENEKNDRVAKKHARQQEALGNFTFDQLAEKYIKWAKGNKKSWQDDKQRYESHLKPTLGQTPIKQITGENLERLKQQLQGKGLAPATVKHCLVIVRHMFNKAIIWEIFNGSNPIKKIKLPRLNNKRSKFLSHEEASLLLDELSHISPTVHDQTLLSLHSGLRFGEIASLKWGDIDFKHDIIHVRTPKAGESRHAYMTAEAKAMLQGRTSEDDKPTKLIFPDRDGNRQKSVSNSFDRTVKKLGFNDGIADNLQRVVFHTLRHTFASWLAMQETPIFTIKELMGHKTLTMTERYAHLIPDHKKQAVKDMADIFRKAQTQTNEKVKTLKEEVKHG